MHILYAAKDVFLEMGFERGSMDTIAERAKTSKRTLYAHFENKEKLYLAVIDLVRELFLQRLRSPAEFSDEPEEALTQFCARFVSVLRFAPVIRMCRMSIAEIDRFPEATARYYQTIFDDVHEVLSGYLKQQFRLAPKASASAAQSLLARIAFPLFARTLFGLEPLSNELTDHLPPGFDLKPIRKTVHDVLASLA